MTTGRAAQARRAADALRQRIAAGEFADGRLPDEQVLSRSLGTSRNVAREALNLLREENLLTRRRGIGTFVTAHTYRHGLGRLVGLAEELTPYGTVSNDVREARLVPHAPPAIAGRLDLPARSEAVYIERLRFLDGSPLSLDSTWLAPDIGRLLLDHDLAGRDLFALIEEVTGAALGSAEVTVHAVTAEPDIARVLDVADGAALFAIDRLTRLPDGRPVDVESLRVRADRFVLSAVLPRS